MQGDTIICEGEPLILPSVNSGGTLQWYKDGKLVTNANTSTYSVYSAGTYMLQESKGACSEQSATVIVRIDPVPLANAGPDQYIVLGQSATLVAKGGVTYAWSPGTTAEVQVVNPTAPSTTYLLTAYSESGLCLDTDEVLVIVELPVTPWNSFSPNGDGRHDSWHIENIENYPDATVEVFNRWGNLVWRKVGYRNDDAGHSWSGENYRSGEMLPVATYYYVIYPNGGAVTTPLQGHVTIVR